MICSTYALGRDDYYEFINYYINEIKKNYRHVRINSKETVPFELLKVLKKCEMFVMAIFSDDEMARREVENLIKIVEDLCKYQLHNNCNLQRSIEGLKASLLVLIDDGIVVFREL